MEEHKLFHERYFLERLLGRGNFSEVWLAKDTKTEIQVALKIYAPATGLDDNGLNIFAREFSLVVNANHKNLLKPLYYDSCDRKPYLVLPFCKEGSIIKQIGKFTEQDAWRLLRDVASGLAWLHAMNPPVIHQDIKPDNVMIGSTGDFMITDFGVSTHLKSTLRKSMSSAFSSAGTIAYMAPERFSKDNTPIMANDIYSLGATVFEMLEGDTPFGDNGGLFQMKGAEIPELKGDFSDQLKKVVNLCLQTHPWERPTAEQLEKYAEAGLRGEKIHFLGKGKSPITGLNWKIVSGVVALTLLLVMGIATMVIRGKKQAKAEMEAQQAIEHTNDSIQQVISQLIVQADAKAAKGDAHDENYEKAYIEAYRLYQEANENIPKLLNGEVYQGEKALQDKQHEIEDKLHTAYNNLMDKVTLFNDEPAVAQEFTERANAVRAILND